MQLQLVNLKKKYRNTLCNDEVKGTFHFRKVHCIHLLYLKVKKPKKATSDHCDAGAKVIYTMYSKHCPYTVAHTFECVCSKINHGLNHGLFISLLKLILCPKH